MNSAEEGILQTSVKVSFGLENLDAGVYFHYLRHAMVTQLVKR